MPKIRYITSPKPRRLSRLAVLPAVMATLGVASVASAHDFWLIPDVFAFAADATVHLNGRSGTRFPNGSAVQPTRVVDARIIGPSSTVKITEMTVEGTSLRLHHKPSPAGQYLVAVGLTSRTTRSTPAGLIRYLRAEGGVAEAARLERENLLAGMDSIVFMGASYAATVVQVGQGGPRAFSLTSGYPLEFVPLNDPAHVHVGDTLHVRVLGAGKPVPNIGVDAAPAVDTTASTTSSGAITASADANGIVHLPLSKAGPWMLRSAFVAPRIGGAPNEWDVSRSTYVWNVGAGR